MDSNFCPAPVLSLTVESDAWSLCLCWRENGRPISALHRSPFNVGDRHRGSPVSFRGLLLPTLVELDEDSMVEIRRSKPEVEIIDYSNES